MAAREQQRLEIGHPAPMKDRVSGLTMLFALAAAPAVWIVQLLVGFAFPSFLCFPDLPRAPTATSPGWMGPVLAATNLLALLLSLVAIGLGIALIRRTREEHEDQPGSLLDAGEGRTRFLAIFGVFTAALFAVAIAFNTLDLWLVQICPA